MKRMLIIYPHWPPSNLVGVHRVRLIANELNGLGWHPIVLTVHEDDYEETPDPLGLKLVDDSVEIVKVHANPPIRLLGKRLIGDIGLRAYSNMKKKALEIASSRSIDCAWISMPSWYPSLIGRALHQHGIPFGVDYQDPWVYALPASAKGFNRACATVALAKILEPIAVRHASFITGINQAYFQGCLDRNLHLKSKPQGELQLGFSPRDHAIPIPELQSPWEDSHRAFIYAGAFLPMSLPLWEQFFDAMALLKQRNQLDAAVRIHLFGTGQNHHTSLQDLAAIKGIEEVVLEHPERIPFLHVQELMRRAEGVLSIGSTEVHYSASKTFQCLLSGKKVFSYFHARSEARSILRSCHADTFHCDYAADDSAAEILSSNLRSYFAAEQEEWQPDLTPLEAFSAKKSAQILIDTVSQIAP